MGKLSREFATSLLTVAFAILAIAIFIRSGASLVFYVLVLIAIVIGFFNAWLISESDNEGAPEERKGVRKGKKSAR